MRQKRERPVVRRGAGNTSTFRGEDGPRLAEKQKERKRLGWSVFEFDAARDAYCSSPEWGEAKGGGGNG